MALIWLSPGLPADRSAIAAGLGPATEISSAAHPPAGTAVAVATVFERPLLDRLAAVPGAGTLLVLKPPGTATPHDLPVPSGPSTVVEAADVGEVVAAIQGPLAGAKAPWPATDLLDGGGAGGWLLARPEAPTGELPSAEPAGVAGAGVSGAPRPSRRSWLASGGIIGAAALVAVVVLATQGGASNVRANGGGGPGFGGRGGYGFTDGGLPGTDGTDRAAQRQAFLDCLQKNGVDTSTFTQGQRSRPSPSDPTMASALQACASRLPMGGDRDGHGGIPPAGTGGPGVPGMGGPGLPGGASGQPPSGWGRTSGATGVGRTT